jgi:hypothetical protein
MMKNWWTKIGCLLTGWNPVILNSCTEASRKQLKKYSSAMLILIILWAFIGYSFAQRYVGAEWWGSLITAVIFVTIVIQIERQIILTVGKNSRLAIFRIIIAFIMAVLGSAIIDQIIFKDDIEKKMIEIVDNEVKRLLPNRLAEINSRLWELQVEIDSLGRKQLALYNDISLKPTINTVSISTINQQIPQQDGTVQTVPQTTTSRTITPIENPKNEEVKIVTKYLDELRKQQEDYTQKKLDAENTLRSELKKKQGFLEELNAIIQLLKERTIALIFYLVLFAFLMSLELFVVVSKIGDKKSDYDLVVEHQLEQKKIQLNNLKRQENNR